MKQLVFLRHGQTVSNNTSCFNRNEEPLNIIGMQQAKAVAMALKNENFDLILCSPLLRTRQTVEPILKNRSTRIEYWPELQEVDWGELQGQPYLPHQEAFMGIEQGLYAEGARDLERRAQAFWDKLKALDANQVLIVSHGAVMCVMFAVHKGLSFEQFEHFRFNEWEVMDNCDIKRLDI